MGAALAAALVRGRVAVVVAWIAATVACLALLPTIREAQTGALGDLVPVNADAITAEERSAELFGFPLISRTQLVVRRPGGLHPVTVAAVTRRVVQLNRDGIPGLRRIAGAYVVPNVTERGAFAPERGTTIVIPLLFRTDVGAGERVRLAHRLAALLRPAGDGAYVGVTGVLSARDAQSGAIADHLPLAELLTVGLVLIAVGLSTRSLVAPLVNLVAVGVGYLVSVRVVGGLGRALGISVPSEVQPVIVALLFGVITDYVLFSLSRYRRRLEEGLRPRDAAVAATRELTPILTACGLAVSAGCGALVAAQLGFLQAFGPGVALSVLVALAVALTFVPAMIALLGPRVLWPARPRRGSPSGAPRTEGLLRRVVARPVLAAIVCLAVLGAMASGLAGLKLGNPIIRGLPAGSEPRQSYEQVRAGIAPGVVSPVVLVVEGAGVARQRQALAALQRMLASRPGVAGVVGPATNPTDRRLGITLASDGNAARYVLFLGDDPLGSRAITRIQDLRGALPGALRAAGLRSATAAIAGDTALSAETIAGARDDVLRVLPAVLAAIAVVLILFLRGLVAPLYLVVVALLAPLAALGLTVYVVQGLFGVPELTYYVPIAAGVLLVALGSDYNVFLVGRIWSEGRRMPLREAIVVGGAGASRAIAAAGIVLAASFAAIAVVPVQAFRELAFTVAAGLLIDAFIVRTVLVPAVIRLVGERSAWPGHALRRQGARAGDAVDPAEASSARQAPDPGVLHDHADATTPLPSPGAGSRSV